MADSTLALAAPPAAPPASPAPPPPAASRPQRECNEAVRLDLARLAEMEMPNVATLLLNGDPWMVQPRVDIHPALAQLVHHAMPLISRLCRDGRLVTIDEVIAFRFLATRCAHGGVDCRRATRTVNDAAEAVMDAILRRAQELDELWGAKNVEAATTVLCGVLENFAARAAAQVKDGYAAYSASEARGKQRDRFRYPRPLDRRSLRSRDRTSRAVLVMVASAHRGGRRALATAAKEIEVQVPGAVDLGMRLADPAHHRVVIRIRDDATLRKVYPVLRYIAVAHGVVIVTRPPVNGMRALRSCYSELCESLREVTRETGRRSGIVPALEDTPTTDAPLPAAA